MMLTPSWLSLTICPAGARLVTVRLIFTTERLLCTLTRECPRHSACSPPRLPRLHQNLINFVPSLPRLTLWRLTRQGGTHRPDWRTTLARTFTSLSSLTNLTPTLFWRRSGHYELSPI